MGSRGRPPAGWYPYGREPDWRWWDGQGWTSAVRPPGLVRPSWASRSVPALRLGQLVAVAAGAGAVLCLVALLVGGLPGWAAWLLVPGIPLLVGGHIWWMVLGFGRANYDLPWWSRRLPDLADFLLPWLPLGLRIAYWILWATLVVTAVIGSASVAFGFGLCYAVYSSFAANEVARRTRRPDH